MNLIIDIGNTQTKAAIFSYGKMVEHMKVENLSDDLTELLSYNGITKAIVSSVGNHHEPDLGIPTLSLNHQTPLPFTNKYLTPASLGQDRMALAAAAVYHFPEEDTLVIDAGTCITYDLIDADGNYHGGGISPGVYMRLRALNHFTARLPEVKPRENIELIGNTSESSILSGTVGGVVREVNATIDAYRQRFSNLNVIITGGDASIFDELSKNSIFAPPGFLMSGLNFILEYNAERL